MAKSHRHIKKIIQNSYPRLEMLLLVAITGLAGFLTSYELLLLSVNTLWVRYLISISTAYIVFLALLGVWLSWKTNRSSLDDLDIPDIYISGNSHSSGSSHHSYHTSDFSSGNGGDFGGGGASGSFAKEGEAIGDAFGAAAQAEEAAVPLMIILALTLALFSVFIATFSVVASAPILFSELLVDGMLSASLYRRLKGLDRRHWLESAIKRTFWPFTFTAVSFVLLGWTIGYFMPHIHSLGEIVRILLG